MKIKDVRLEWGQFIAAISVVLIHCGRLVENDVLHFILKSTFARLAVPLFIVTTSFFYRKKVKQDTAYKRNFFRKQLKIYLILTVLYLPYGIYFIRTIDLPTIHYPIAFFVAIFYSGICYHLWYFPALFFALIITDFLNKFWRYKFIFASSSLLFLFGSMETYSNHLKNTMLEKIYLPSHAILLTFRNGLFYSFVFIAIGFFIADHEKSPFLQKRLLKKCLFSFILFVIECLIIFRNQGADKNFMLSSLPMILFLFSLFIRQKTTSFRNTWIRKYTRYLFYLHPMILELLNFYLKQKLHIKVNGLTLFMITLILTFSCSWFILSIGKSFTSLNYDRIKKKIIKI